jgi:transcriptional regulator with XRE-family HTH domain
VAVHSRCRRARGRPQAHPKGDAAANPAGIVETMHARPIDAGAALRAARRVRHLSQRELADTARVPRSTVERIEAGGCDPRIGTVARILAAVGVELAPVLAGQPIPIDQEREAIRDIRGRHLPAHCEIEKTEWLDGWWGWWRKNPKIKSFPVKYWHWYRFRGDAEWRAWLSRLRAPECWWEDAT